MIYDCIIIGAGVTGAMIARDLSFYDLNVLLIDKHPDLAMEATKANSAIVHGGYAEAHETLKGRMSYPGRIKLQALADELHVPYRSLPTLVVGHRSDREQLEKLLHNGQRNGLTDLRVIEEDEIYEREPNLAPGFELALLCEGAGTISPYELTIALVEDAMRHGLSLHLGEEVLAIEREEEHFTLKTSLGRTLQTHYLVNAAGTAADRIAGMLGIDDYTIRPRSGEYIVLRRGSHPLPNHTIFGLPGPWGKGIVVTHTVDGNIMLGPDAEQQDEPYSGTHIERLKKVWAQAKQIRPDLKPESFIRSFAGVRASSDRGDFIIRGDQVPGFVEAAGIESPGLTAAPIIAERVCDLLAEAGMKLEAKPDRQPPLPALRHIKEDHEWLPWPAVQKDTELPKDDPERMICRCEQVRLKEIEAVLNRPTPAHTVDAVKRRVRVGMGACQGAFCRPKLAEILAERYPNERERIWAEEDAQHSGVSRVGREELIAALSQSETENA